MKYKKVIVFLALLMKGWAVQAACHPAALKDLTGVDRYTLLADGTLHRELGTLYIDRGFIVSAVRDNPFYDPLTHQPSGTTMGVINGQVVMSLSTWVAVESFGNNSIPKFDALCNFSRSAATYTIDDVPWVIVTATPGGGGSGGGSSGGAFVKTPKVSISAVVPSCTETAGTPCQFMITLSGPTRKTTRVRFTVDGKATRGQDYLRFPNTVSIPSGNVSAIIEVVPIDDTKRESTENVKIKLLPQPAYKLKRASANVQIVDND